MLRILPSPAHRILQIRLGDLLPARKVPRGDLGVDLDARVGRDEVLGYVVPLEDRDAGFDYRVVFPISGEHICYFPCQLCVCWRSNDREQREKEGTS